jgi:hypothetical protein
VLQLARGGQARFDEWTWDTVGNETARVSLRFDLQ